MKTLTTILLVVWTLIMAWLLLTPGSPDVSLFHFEGADKLAHFSLFLGWSFLMTLRGYYSSTNTRLILLVVFCVSLIIGGGTELLQGVIPNRSRELVDFFADVLGALGGLLLAVGVKRVLLVK